MSTLRNKLIRLAHENPELRKDLLPLLKTAKGIAMGKTWENDKVRAHRYRDSLWVWDLTNAGKRGKKCDRAVVNTTYSYDGDKQSWLDRVTQNLKMYGNFDGFVGFIKDLQHDFPGEIDLKISPERGVDVTPAGFGPIKIEGKGVSIRSEWNDFSVRDNSDQYNLPSCIPASRGGKKDIKVFYRWVKDNQSALKRMSYRDVLKAMNGLGIKYHTYCAMD